MPSHLKQCSEPNSLIPPPGQLRPVTSSDTQRYDNFASVKVTSRLITPGFASSSKQSRPGYLPEHWTLHVDPEGSRYFCYNSQPRVVTPSDMSMEGNIRCINGWLKHVQMMLVQQNISLTPEIELFLRLDGDDCDYYLIDHSTQREFWPESIDSECLGLTPTASSSHLELCLENLYWAHVEQFPMHITLPSAKITELRRVLLHAQTDKLTSLSSTFTFSTEECEKFFTILSQAGDISDDGHIVALVARLWQSISSNRFWTHHGQATARCARDQTILFDDSESSFASWIGCMMKPITFGSSDLYLAKLGDAFADRLVYKDIWQKLVSYCVDNWRRTSLMAYLLLVLHAVFFVSLGGFNIIGIVSGILCVISILSSTVLLHRYEPLRETPAECGFEHLSSVCSPRFKFQFVAIAYALPETSYLWSIITILGTFFYVCITTLAREYSIYTAVFVSASILLVAFLFHRSTAESSICPTWSCLRGSLSGKKIALEEEESVESPV